MTEEKHEKQKVTTTLEEAHEAGYLGEVPDDTPNEHYTVEGVTSGKETPESAHADEQAEIEDKRQAAREEKGKASSSSKAERKPVRDPTSPTS